MKNINKLFGLVFITIIFAINLRCSDEIVCPEEESPSIIVTKLSHSEGMPGEKIIAYGKGFYSVNHLAYVRINHQYSMARITSDSTIFIIIPQGINSGFFEFHFSTKDTILLSNKFTFISNYDSPRWNTKVKISKEDSKTYNSMGDTLTWRLETNQDSIFLIKEGLCGDDCWLSQTIAFRHISNDELPEFLFYSHNKKIYSGVGSFEDTVRYGTVTLDSWNIDSLISGTYLFGDYDCIFYATPSQ